jgi:hypothetical protein
MSTENTPSAFSDQVEVGKMLAGIGLSVASVVFPGAGAAITLAGIGVKGVADLIIKAHKALMDKKPDNVTVEEWREILSNPALEKTLEQRLAEKLNPPAPPPAQNLGDVMGSIASG